MATILTPEQLDKAVPRLLALVLKSGDNGYRDDIDGFDPIPSEDNDWLRQEDGSYQGVFLDRLMDGKFKRVRFKIYQDGATWRSETWLDRPDPELAELDDEEPEDIDDFIDIEFSNNPKKEKIRKVLREYKAGKLHSGKGGTVVKDWKQAIAIALNYEEEPEFGAIIDRVLKWNGLNIGVEYLPGQVRWPGKRHSKKLRSAYGHVRN